MIPFAGWNMPVQYTSIMDEHNAVRTDVGIFDISHMGQFFLEGEGAEAWLNTILANDVNKLGFGEGQYTLMLNENGGVIDDLIIYRQTEGRLFLVVNASMVDVDYGWLGRMHPPHLQIFFLSKSCHCGMEWHHGAARESCSLFAARVTRARMVLNSFAPQGRAVTGSGALLMPEPSHVGLELATAFDLKSATR